MCSLFTRDFGELFYFFFIANREVKLTALFSLGGGSLLCHCLQILAITLGLLTRVPRGTQGLWQGVAPMAKFRLSRPHRSVHSLI